MSCNLSRITKDNVAEKETQEKDSRCLCGRCYIVTPREPLRLELPTEDKEEKKEETKEETKEAKKEQRNQNGHLVGCGCCLCAGKKEHSERCGLSFCITSAGLLRGPVLTADGEEMEKKEGEAVETKKAVETKNENSSAAWQYLSYVLSDWFMVNAARWNRIRIGVGGIVINFCSEKYDVPAIHTKAKQFLNSFSALFNVFDSTDLGEFITIQALGANDSILLSSTVRFVSERPALSWAQRRERSKSVQEKTKKAREEQQKKKEDQQQNKEKGKDCVHLLVGAAQQKEEKGKPTWKGVLSAFYSCVKHTEPGEVELFTEPETMRVRFENNTADKHFDGILLFEQSVAFFGGALQMMSVYEKTKPLKLCVRTTLEGSLTIVV